jgi:hypothetical protein
MLQEACALPASGSAPTTGVASAHRRAQPLHRRRGGHRAQGHAGGGARAFDVAKAYKGRLTRFERANILNRPRPWCANAAAPSPR